MDKLQIEKKKKTTLGHNFQVLENVFNEGADIA